MFCYNCGKKIENDDKFCSGCGKPIRDLEEEKKEVKETKEKEEVQKIEENEKKTLKKSLFKTKSPIKSLIYKGIIISLAICVFIEVCLILVGSMSEVHFKVIGSMVYIGIFGIFASQYANLYEKSNYKDLAVVAIIISVILFIISSLINWELLKIESDIIIKIIVSLSIICVAIYHSSKILLVNLKNEIAKKFSSAALFLIGITYTLGIFWLFTETSDQFFVRLVLIFSILTLFTTIATPITNKIK